MVAMQLHFAQKRERFLGMQRLKIRKTALCFIRFIAPKLQLIRVAEAKHMLFPGPLLHPAPPKTLVAAQIHVIVRSLCKLYIPAELIAL